VNPSILVRLYPLAIHVLRRNFQRAPTIGALINTTVTRERDCIRRWAWGKHPYGQGAGLLLEVVLVADARTTPQCLVLSFCLQRQHDPYATVLSEHFPWRLSHKYKTA